MPETYASRLSRTLPAVRDQIAEAATSVGRDPAEITVVAVTKGHPVEACRAALAAGLTDLGENRVSELEEKVAAIGHDGVRWHMIGHVQRRKAPRLPGVADLLHSLDSLRLARRFQRVQDAEERDTPDAPLDVLFQVNTSGEEAKYGFEGGDVVERVLEAAALRALRARGLMTMAPFTDDESVLRTTFRRLRELRDRLRKERPDFGPELSMGMTNDLRIAVEEGSTMVRIGTALFGARAGETTHP